MVPQSDLDTIAIPTFLHGSESWVFTESQESHMQAEEMRSLGAVKGCEKRDRLQLSNLIKDCERFKLQVYSLQNKLEEHRRRWMRMDPNRLKFTPPDQSFLNAELSAMVSLIELTSDL